MTATAAPFLVKMSKLFLFYVSPLLLNSLYTTILVTISLQLLTRGQFQSQMH